MPLKFNINCTITKRGTTDVYGQKVLGDVFDEKCQIVKLEPRIQRSDVRTDSGASRTRADENRVDAVILVSKNTKADFEDELTVDGVVLRIMRKRHRFTVTGILDHYELTCEAA